MNAAVCDKCAGAKTTHEKQVRICKAPNILVVQVRRVEDEQHDVIRHAVVPEEDLSLPGLGQYELAGVVYHSGQRPTSGHYTCACRGPDRMFWRADDSHFLRATLDVERTLLKQVYSFVYTRPRGTAVFKGMGDARSVPDCYNGVAHFHNDAGRGDGRGETSLGVSDKALQSIDKSKPNLDHDEKIDPVFCDSTRLPHKRKHEGRSASVDRSPYESPRR